MDPDQMKANFCCRFIRDKSKVAATLTQLSPSSWSSRLAWIEYAHKFMTSAATGLSPFESSLGYQPPLFPSQESEPPVLSVQYHFGHCRKVWMETPAALLSSVENNSRITDLSLDPSPECKTGQKV